MMIKAGITIADQFTVTDSNGALVAADATPTVVVVLAGVDNAAVATVTTPATGIYKYTYTVPTVTVGTAVSERISATVGGVATATVRSRGVAVPANVYDSLIAGTDNINATMDQASVDAIYDSIELNYTAPAQAAANLAAATNSTRKVIMTRGETVPIVVRLYDSTGACLTLPTDSRAWAKLATSGTATAILSWDTNNVADAIEITSAGDASNPATITITPTSSQSLALTPGMYYLGVWFVRSGATVAVRPALRVQVIEGVGEDS